MFKSILKYSFRSLLKNKVVSVFNIIGLTLALSSLLFIFSHIRHELSFDRFHDNYQGIYNVYIDETDEGVRDQYIQTPYGLGTYLAEDYPDVETMARTCKYEESIVKKVDGEEFKDDLLLVDPDFFSLFNVDFLNGFKQSILQSPNQVCISQKCAFKYFANEDPLGKTLKINSKEYEVKAVFKDYPENSHLQFDLIGSLSTITSNRDKYDLDGYMYTTYIKLRKGVNSQNFEHKMQSFITNRLAPFVEKAYQLDVQEWFSRGNSINLKLMPVSKIHLYASHIAGFEEQANISNVILISLISALLVFIACFNFINFNVSAFRRRSVSVGIKKICGSNKFVISFQSFIESFLVYSVSAIIALIIYKVFSTGINETFKYGNSSIGLELYLLLLIGGMLIAFICGFLPTYLNIKRIPYSILKSTVNIKEHRILGNRLFVGFQFMVAIIILIFFIVINNQVDLITTHYLGFDKENVMIIHRTNRDRAKAFVLADQLRKLPGIKAVSVANAYPGTALPTKDLELEDSPDGFSYSPQYYNCDSEMNHVLNLKLVEGEFFSKKTSANSILLNEKAAKLYGIENHPIGSVFTRSSGETYKVIGVVKDFNFRSLHRSIEPLCIYTGIDRSNSLGASTILIKMNHTNKHTIETIQQKWNEVYGDTYFDYSFLNDKISALYKKELVLRRTVPVSAFIALFISVIGLLGITYLKMDEKKKEIGVRKVNGAKITEILTMLNKDFVKWVLIAFVAATPIAWYAMNKWLENFAYKTDLSWWIFALAGLLALGIALLTVSWQSWRAATRNPVEALRYE
ncbi:ABC transporter permease [Saccharicrinis sp. FJH62]|uniref:ABC transporter permease n=1 Tax=Saccharicrinis sp. FJH62 TaxID=3344657 RepID=UPI0035D4FAED